MDWEAVKLIGVAVGLISGALTVGEKLCKWGKSAYQYIKKSKNLVAPQDGSAELPAVIYPRNMMGTREQVIEHLSKTVPRPPIFRGDPAPFTACGPGTGMVSKPDFVTFGGHSLFKKT